MKTRRWLAWGTLALGVGCGSADTGTGGQGRQHTRGPLAEAWRLVEQGRLDDALRQAEQAPRSSESVYLQGVVWARRAESAPLPTPAPLASPLPRGAPPGPPEFKPEELKAIELFELAAAMQPPSPEAPRLLAELLAPHAVRRHARERTRLAAARKKPPREGSPPGDDPDFSPERVIRAYEQAVAVDPASIDAVEGLIAFGTEVGALDVVERGLRELVRRKREDALPLVRYGDFLVKMRQKPLDAVQQYEQALVWRPDDGAVNAKIGDIFIELGVEHYEKKEYMSAETRFEQARKYAADPNAPQGLRLKHYDKLLREIRGR